MALTRDFLKQQLPDITKEQIDAIMKEHGDTINPLNNQITSLTTERDGFKNQLEQRNADLDDLKKKVGDSDSLKQQLDDLQAKYKTDTDKLTNDLETQKVDFATEKYFANIKFTSDLAKKAAIQEFKSKNFKLKDGVFEGGDAFIAEMKKNNASAFIEEKQDGDGKDGDGAPPPMFSSGSGGNGGSGKDNNPFSFNFTSVRTAETK